MTTQTFADYAAQQDARNTVHQSITKYCFMVCDALVKNYVDYSIKSHEKAIANYEYTYGTTDSVQSNYHKESIAKLKDGICDYTFYVQSGRKYHKIMMNAAGSHSVHAFVDRKTGEMYKAASFKAPAKGVRFNLNVIKDREFVLEHADWAGGYLYK